MHIASNEILSEISISTEMKNSYLDYSMSVIVTRALPDIRDGLKPVQRRILFSMYETGCLFNKPHKKSARIVGDVMGKYHPHGDSSIYEALVRMAQIFSLRNILIDGQGNFGSIDGDNAAAMRYTESRLSKLAHSLLDDIDQETVDFIDNYDGLEQEPVILPAKFPNLLVNGSGGIAVGMATNIPTHNLGEVIDATSALIDNPAISLAELIEIIPGPDFPTGGSIIGRAPIYSAFTNGKGIITIRGKAEFETTKDSKQAIIITEIPYQVNKAKLIEKIAELIKEKRIEGISDVRDESNKKGIKVVVELKKDANRDVILNQLYSYTALQSSFGINMLAISNSIPKQFGLKGMLEEFLDFRVEVVTKRTLFLLNKAKARAHILLGLAVAISVIDEIIALIKASKNTEEARENLMSQPWDATTILELQSIIQDQETIIKDDNNMFLTFDQAKAILDMRLHRLTGLEIEKIKEELNAITKDIAYYNQILSNKRFLLDIIKSELNQIKENFATPRLTQIEDSELDSSIEDLIPKEDMVVTVTVTGYVKRVPLDMYRSQRRGGKGKSGVNMYDDDATSQLFVANTHTKMLFFTTKGKVYQSKIYKLPVGTPQTKGRALVNIFPLDADEKVNNIITMPEDIADKNIIFATSAGNIRRNDISDFENINAGGKIAMKLEEDDRLVGVRICNPEEHILLASASGKAVRFSVDDLRVFKSRTSDGVRGIRLGENDELVSMSILNNAEIDKQEMRDEFLSINVETRKLIAISNNLEEFDLNSFNNNLISAENILQYTKDEQFILTITENGYGKITSAYEYRVTNRGGSGIINIITSERNGNVITSFAVKNNDEIMLLTQQGKILRCSVKQIRVIGRNTQGVLIFRLTDNEKISSAVLLPANEDSSLDEEDMIEGDIED